MKTSDIPIAVEQTFKLTIADVWNALTEVDEMKQCFFDNIPAFKAEPGFETQFVVQAEDRIFTHLWKITEVIPFEKITYNWKYAEYPGDSSLKFKLFKVDDLVLLEVSMKIDEDFPEDIPEFSRESCIGGWNYFIGENLKAYLENK